MVVMAEQPFPKKFLWGASTSSHQVEGGTETDWDRWERTHAAGRPRTFKVLLSKLPHWPELRARASLPDTYICGQAVDHYHRYREDFDILQSLNMNAFRFSIEWARIEPREGEWNQTEINHYRQYLEELHKRGIEPFVTLWHFTLPTWFADKGGFARKQNLAFYLRFVEKIATELGDLLTYVSPLNEPNTFAVMGYVLGWWPPQRRNLYTAAKVYKNLIAAHKGAYAILKAHNSSVQVGSAMALTNDVRKSGSFIARFSVFGWSHVWNRWFLDATRNSYDFIGFNYYMTNYFGWYGAWVNPREPRSDLGWYMEPRSIGSLLTTVYRRYQIPIYITENGLADAKDRYRQWWLEETIIAMRQALADGVDLRGYLHWSLLDNFEWAFGWLAEFGLVHVDRSTLQRSVRPSAKWFGEQIGQIRNLGSDRKKTKS
jgi:beta-glucosidase